MKRKNLITNILNIIALALSLTWFLLEINDDLYLVSITFMLSGLLATFAIYIFLGATSIINLVIGIKNRKESIPCLVLYEIIAVLYILEMVFVFCLMLYGETVFGILTIAIYALTFLLSIIQFILSRKVNKPTKKSAIGFIILVIATLLGIFLTLCPLIVKYSIKGKVEKAIEESSGATDDTIIYGSVVNADKYNFLNTDGSVLFTIDAEYVDDCDVLTSQQGKSIKAAIILNNGKYELIDISNPQNIKTILKYTECDLINSSSVPGFCTTADLARISHFSDEEESTSSLIQLDSEDEEDFSAYENSDTARYTYYSNGNYTVQEEENINSGLLTENENQESPQTKYYLIKQGEKQEILCDKPIYKYESNLNTEGLQLFNDKYLTYFKEDKCGYIDLETGESLEIPNSYMFLDVNETTMLVARVKQKDRGRNLEDSDYENIEVMLIDKNLNILSEKYKNVIIDKGFYAFNYLSDGELTVINKKNEVLCENGTYFGMYKNELLVVKNDNGECEVYNENGKQKEIYKKVLIEGKYAKNPEYEDGYEIYKTVVEQMK